VAVKFINILKDFEAWQSCT